MPDGSPHDDANRHTTFLAPYLQTVQTAHKVTTLLALAPTLADMDAMTPPSIVLAGSTYTAMPRARRVAHPSAVGRTNPVAIVERQIGAAAT